MLLKVRVVAREKWVGFQLTVHHHSPSPHDHKQPVFLLENNLQWPSSIVNNLGVMGLVWQKLIWILLLSGKGQIAGQNVCFGQLSGSQTNLWIVQREHFPCQHHQFEYSTLPHLLLQNSHHPQ